ncbi:unnamed protein product [Clavelina lepadiformis]|uniref:LRRNT domain-containing protein n=1 Tax=Clavelina lepadiformis TaxID=159417 RepID=A0ABP0GCU6_CLALP
MSTLCRHLCFTLLLSVVVGQTNPQNSSCPFLCSCSGSEVDCSEKNIQEVVWKFPSSTVTLSLRHNNISEISTSNFEISHHSLQRLDISQNSLQSVPSALLSLPELTFVNLSHNVIVFDFHDGAVFSANTKLVTLDLSYNDLEYVIPWWFQLLGDLKVVHLDGNRLSQFNFLLFMGSPKLTTVTVGNNLISNLAFGVQADVRTLDLSGNKFVFTNETELSRITPRLNDLRIGHTGLQYFDRTFADLPGLYKLGLFDCEQTHLSSDLFQSSTLLAHLSLAGGSLDAIDLAKMSNLQSLILTDLDNLTSFTVTSCHKFTDLSIKNAQNLREVTVKKGRKFERFFSREIFSNANEITKLTLSVLKLGKLRRLMFDNLPELELLDLSSDRITAIENDVFSHLPKLRRLDLSGNLLSAVASGTFSSATLTYLDLSRNFITHVSAAAFSALPSLEHVNLSENKLRTFPRPESVLPFFELRSNPWECSCELHATIASLLLADGCLNKDDSECFRCTAPSGHEVKSLFHLEAECKGRNAGGSPTPGAMTETIVIALAASMGGILSAIFVIAIAWKRGCLRKKRTSVAADDSVTCSSSSQSNSDETTNCDYRMEC